MAVSLLPGRGDDQALSTSRALVFTTTDSCSVTNPETYIIQNNDATNTVTVGGADVASGSNGVLLRANQADTVTLRFREPGVPVYAIAGGGTPSVQVLRVE